MTDAMDVFDCYNWAVRKLTLHGCAIEISCACDALQPVIDHFVRPFRETGFPEGFVPVRGVIEPFDLDEIVKHLPPHAVPMTSDAEDGFELYRDGDRFYRVDESVGMMMLDPVRRRWHAWVTASALAGDAINLADATVFWPLAQLLASRGLHLVPAVAVEREGSGVLLLGDLPLEPELSALAAAGCRIIGQRWTAMREDDPRISLQHVPGHVMRRPAPRRPGEAVDGLLTDRAPRTAKSDARPPLATLDLSMPPAKPAKPEVRSAREVSRFDEPVWIDLIADGASVANHAFCRLVLICSPGRRQDFRAREVGWAGSLNVLRRAWPIAGLPPARHGGKLVSRLASRVRIVEVQLSQRPGDLLDAIDRLRIAPPPPHLAPIKLPINSAMVKQMARSSARPARRSA